MPKKPLDYTFSSGETLNLNMPGEVEQVAVPPVQEPRQSCRKLNVAMLLDIVDRNMNKWFPLDEDKADAVWAYNHIWVDGGGCPDCQKMVEELDSELQPNGWPSTHIPPQHHIFRKVVGFAENCVMGVFLDQVLPGTGLQKIAELMALRELRERKR